MSSLAFSTTMSDVSSCGSTPYNAPVRYSSPVKAHLRDRHITSSVLIVRRCGSQNLSSKPAGGETIAVHLTNTWC